MELRIVVWIVEDDDDDDEDEGGDTKRKKKWSVCEEVKRERERDY